jgi:endo-1,4-beta-xylanase
MDPSCQFSADHGQFQLGFHFAWNNVFLDDLADWVLEIDDPIELERVLRARVRTIFERCPGIDRLDVVNEPLGPFNVAGIFVNHFYAVLGADYIAQLFRIVREEAPEHVELFLNENFVEYFRPRAETYMKLVEELVDAGVPVDAVGIQTHLFLGDPDFTLFREILERVEGLGLKVFLSELDVPVPRNQPDRFTVQAERYRRTIETCLAVPACDTIIVWGIDDAHTWLDFFDIFTGPDPDPLLFDDALLPKPAYFAVRDALLRGRGGDHPVSGHRLTLVRDATGRTKLSVWSRDAEVVSPSPRSTNDPSREHSEGATIELRWSDRSTHAIDLPGGAGWRVREGRAFYSGPIERWGRPDSGSPQHRLHLREGDGLFFQVADVPIDPLEAREGLGIRITMGSLRVCLDFAAGTIEKRGDRVLIARESPAREGFDCANPDDPN